MNRASDEDQQEQDVAAENDRLTFLQKVCKLFNKPRSQFALWIIVPHVQQLENVPCQCDWLGITSAGRVNIISKIAKKNNPTSRLNSSRAMP